MFQEILRGRAAGEGKGYISSKLLGKKALPDINSLSPLEGIFYEGISKAAPLFS